MLRLRAGFKAKELTWGGFWLPHLLIITSVSALQPQSSQSSHNVKIPCLDKGIHTQGLVQFVNHNQ